jgi:mRNA-degrading endonuclease RelE of RelBE toxin-antitoxin system
VNSSDPEKWEVRISPTALRKLQIGPPAGLPSHAAFAALEFINGPLLLNPHRVGKPLQGDLAGKHEARRGDYRVVYLIDEVTHQITVLDVGYCGHIYHRR